MDESILHRLLFDIFAIIALACGVLTVTRRNPVYGAVWLMGAFLSMAGIFVLLEAPFLAAMHVLIYTGAILVLFLFVIMLLNLRPEELAFDVHPAGARVVAAVVVAATVGLAAWVVVPALEGTPAPGPAPEGFGSIRRVGEKIFETYVLAFEMVALLILAAVVGGLVLGRPRS